MTVFDQAATDAGQRGLAERARREFYVKHPERDPNGGIYKPVPDARPEAVLDMPVRIEPGKKRFTFETIDDIFEGEDEKYLIDGWIPETGVGLFYARWGSFKTFI